jgi:hypothetical protein
LTTSTQWNFKVPSPIIINLNNLFWLRRLWLIGFMILCSSRKKHHFLKKNCP